MSIALALLAALIVAVVVLYNRLIRSRNRVNTAWSDIDVQLQRRHDLIPQLVKAVEGVTRLLALAESYPDLKANENFLNLQNELVETEDYLQFARRYYNGSVRDYNTMTETVPSNIVAGMFGFRQREFFQKTSDEAANVPLVKLGSVE